MINLFWFVNHSLE